MKIKDECGVWVEDHRHIAEKFIMDYTQCIKSSCPASRILADLGLPKLITNSENRSLIKLPNLEEVRQALLGIDSGKTPGPDRFGAGFFKTHWT